MSSRHAIKLTNSDKFTIVDTDLYPEIAKHTTSWNLNNRGRVQGRSKILKRIVLLHRLVWFLKNGDFPNKGLEIDHIDIDGLNNTYDNLRVVTHKVNMHNKKPRGKSQFLGVCWDKRAGKWHARIRDFNSKYRHLGYFVEERDAALAYANAAIQMNLIYNQQILEELRAWKEEQLKKEKEGAVGGLKRITDYFSAEPVKKVKLECDF